MRLIALLILPSLAFAAPVPKQTDKPAVEVTLSAHNQLVLDITIRNTGKEVFKVPYRYSQWERIEIDLLGENGKKYTIRYKREEDDKEEPGTLTIPAGESVILSFHACHSLPELGEPQNVTFVARLKIDGKTIESDPLIVKR